MPSSYEKMRERSGEIISESKLVGFLYILMRDHVPPGNVESIIRDVKDLKEYSFSNGWLANYAIDIADRLMGEKK